MSKFIINLGDLTGLHGQQNKGVDLLDSGPVAAQQLPRLS